jgi:hypothetical protein
MNSAGGSALPRADAQRFNQARVSDAGAPHVDRIRTQPGWTGG